MIGKRGCVIAVFVTSLSSGTAPAADVSADAWCGGVRHLWTHTVPHRLAERGASRSEAFHFLMDKTDPMLKGNAFHFVMDKTDSMLKGNAFHFVIDKTERMLKGKWSKQNVY